METEVTRPIRNGSGRRRDETRGDALRAAALELVREVGYEQMTMDAIADRASAGKPTIYRRWSDKAELLADALASLPPVPWFPDTGELRADLYAVADALIANSQQLDVSLIVGLLGAIHRDARLHRAFDEYYLAPRLAAIRAVFQRADARGELSSSVDIEQLVSLFSAITLQELLLFGRTPQASSARRVMDDVVLRLAQASNTGTPATDGWQKLEDRKDMP